MLELACRFEMRPRAAAADAGAVADASTAGAAPRPAARQAPFATSTQNAGDFLILNWYDADQ